MNISSINNLASHLAAATPVAQPIQPQSEDQKALIRAVKAVNAAQLFGQDNEITFIISRALKTAVVRVINKETGEVIQQIPNEQVLKMAEENSGR